LHARGGNPRPCPAAAPPLATTAGASRDIHLRDAGEHGRDAHLVPLGLGCPRLPDKKHADTRLSRSRPRAGQRLSAHAAAPGAPRGVAVFSQHESDLRVLPFAAGQKRHTNPSARKRPTPFRRERLSLAACVASALCRGAPRSRGLASLEAEI
jgi:hypothetical protein